MLHSLLLTLSLGLLVLLCHTDASIVYSSRERILASVDNQDPFEATVLSYARAGLGMQMPWANGTGCKAISEVFNAKEAATNASASYGESILMTSWNQAWIAGCDTITEVAQAALDYSATLPTNNYPKAKTIIIGMVEGSGVLASTPLSPLTTEGFMSRKGKYDGPVEGMDVTLVTLNDLAELITASTKAEGIFTVLQDEGPWNRLFAHRDYVAFRIVMAIIAAALFLHNCWRLFPLIVARQFALDVRNLVFLTALIAAGLLVPTMAVREFSGAWNVLLSLVVLLSSLALQLLLLLWTNVLIQLYRRERFAQAVRILICLTILVSFVNFFVSTVGSAISGRSPSSPNLTILIYIFTMLNTTAAMATSIIFFIYSIQFLRRRSAMHISKETRRALTKLAYLAWSASALYICMAAFNLANGLVRDLSPVGLAVCLIGRNILLLARLIALLAVLGLRVPSKPSTTIGSSAMASSQGFSRDRFPSHAPTYLEGENSGYRAV